MGNKESKRTQRNFSKKNLNSKFLKKCEEFVDFHTKLDYLMFEQNFEIVNEGSLERFIEEIWIKFHYDLEKSNISKTRLKELICEKFAEEYLKDDLVFKKYKIHDFFLELFENLTEEKFTKIEILLRDIAFYLNLEQRGISIKKEEEASDHFSLVHVLTNICYNKMFSCGILIFYLNDSMFEESILCLICEIIENQQRLETLIINYDSCQDYNELQNVLIRILSSISQNDSIKSLFVGSLKMNNFTFSEQVGSNLQNIIEKDQLFCFGLGNLNLSENTFQNLYSSIITKRNLKHLGFFYESNFTLFKEMSDHQIIFNFSSLFLFSNNQNNKTLEDKLHKDNTHILFHFDQFDNFKDKI